MMTATITRPCAAGMHAACPETRATCGCESCHKGPCTLCAADNLQTLYGEPGAQVCAPCRRAMPRPVHRAVCEKCGAGNAFRNPRARRPEVLCRTCHIETGIPVTLRAIDTVALAACHGQAEGHDWVHVRGTRFACSRCYVRKFDAAMRAAMRKEELNG